MVLDNSSTEEFRDDSAPPTDYDAYDANSAIQYLPLPANLPRSPFVSADRLAISLRTKQRDTSALLNRPLTKGEADAVAYWGSKYAIIRSYGSPVGIAIGAYRTWETRSTYRFPFYTPKFTSNHPDFFPGSSFPWVKGSQARFLWHTARTCSYMTLFALSFRSIFQTYAFYVCGAGTLQDPRLKSVLEAMKKRTSRQNPGRVSPPIVARDGNPASTGESVYSSNNGVPTQSELATPQMSRNDEELPASTNVFSTSSFSGGNEAQSDDASPISGGSAWGRIRQQAASGKAPPNPDSWATAKSVQTKNSDEEAYSKHEANLESERAREQKEFERRIEQERRGGNFGAGGAKGW